MKIKKINKGSFMDIIIFNNVKAISLCPFGIYFRSLGKYTVNHEKIHWRQQLEMLIIFFYVLYLLEYFIRLFMLGNAYMNISFEREAFDNQNNPEYLEKRKPYSWVKYIKKRT